MGNRKINKEIIEDQDVRIDVARKSHRYFFATYLASYVKHETAPFQKEIFKMTENNNIKLSVIVSFRGSGKSTIVSLSYPLWALLGKLQKKFIVIISQTQSQARLLISNIKSELETNTLLRADLGPFEDQSAEWGLSSLVFKKYNARIVSASTEQSIRGIRHGAYRPDLIVIDDIEDLNSVKTREGRNKIYNWLKGDVLPLGDKNTKTVVIGNLLHEDSVLMRLRDEINRKQLSGIFRSYPLLDSKNKIAWPDRYPTIEDIKEKEKEIGNPISWQREYMLRIVPDTDQIIHRGWIKTYNELPSENTHELCFTATAVDLAISQKETADYTAMITANVYWNDEKERNEIYILPNIVNKRLNFPQTIEQIKMIVDEYKSEVIVEDIAYQTSVIQQLEQDGYEAEPTKMPGSDKRARLSLISQRVFNGQVLFPREGSDLLVNQIVNFGVEKHDDLADALSYLAIKVLSQEYRPFDIDKDFFIA